MRCFSWCRRRDWDIQHTNYLLSKPKEQTRGREIDRKRKIYKQRDSSTDIQKDRQIVDRWMDSYLNRQRNREIGTKRYVDRCIDKQRQIDRQGEMREI